MKTKTKLSLISSIFALSLSAISSVLAADAMRPYLPTDQAMKAVQACMNKAQAEKWQMSIVVLDRGENVLASARMDQALPASYKGATLKAQTSLSWGMATDDVNNVMTKMPVFKQFPGILGIAGGLPIQTKDQKNLIGSIGVAGSSPDNDKACAQAAIDSLSKG